MNIVPQSMLGAAAGIIDPEEKVLQLLKRFEQEVFQAKQAGQQRTTQYRETKEELGGQIKQAGETYATAPKAGTADIALTAASLILPVIGALLPQGRGLRGQRAKAGKQQALTGLGRGLGQFQQLRMAREERGRERQYAGKMKGLEHLSDLADMIYEGQERQAMGQLGAAGELMRGGIAAERVRQLGLPKPEKGPSLSLLNTMNRQAQTDVRREQAQTQKDILVQANQITRPLFGMEFVVNSIQDLDEAIYTLTKRFPKSDYSPAMMRGSGYGIVQQLKALRDQYYGEETPMLPMGGGASPEEQADFERLKRKYGTQ